MTQEWVLKMGLLSTLPCCLSFAAQTANKVLKGKVRLESCHPEIAQVRQFTSNVQSGARIIKCSLLHCPLRQRGPDRRSWKELEGTEKVKGFPGTTLKSQALDLC